MICALRGDNVGLHRAVAHESTHVYMRGILLLELMTLPSELAFLFCDQNVFCLSPTLTDLRIATSTVPGHYLLSRVSFFLLITLHCSPQGLAVPFKIRHRLKSPPSN